MDELNPTNAFGEDLLNAIEAQYETIDDGIAAIMETTGLSEEEVVSIIQGDTIVDDEQLLSAIIDAFPDADDDDVSVLIESATAVDEADREALIAEIEANEESMAEGDDEGADYSAYYRQASFQQANYLSQLEQENRYLQQALQNQNARLNNVEATFSAQQAADALDQINSYADTLVEAGYMPPSIKHMILGSFSHPSERLANFSSLADQNGVDVQTQLYATQYALELMQQVTSQGIVDFQDYSLDAASLQHAEFSASLDELAAQDAVAILGDKMLEVR